MSRLSIDSTLDHEGLAWRHDRALLPGAVQRLDAVVGPSWGGPLIVSMPRTGSTLLATLFLLLSDPPGSGLPVFDRYLHEPIAPMFWAGASFEDVLDGIGRRLTKRDIVQESAYQFAGKEIARWFLRQARQPIAFTVRHPQMAWPSRWRIMLEMRLVSDPEHPEADAMRWALDEDNFVDLGTLLTQSVEPADNGWFALLSLVDTCRREGIEYVIVDNAGFRRHPDAVLAQLCGLWGLEYDPAMTAWSDLRDAHPRIVMSDLASGPEYGWYYERTLSTSEGIVRTDREPLPVGRFPPLLRGTSANWLTIDEAVKWYHLLLEQSHVLGP